MRVESVHHLLRWSTWKQRSTYCVTFTLFGCCIFMTRARVGNLLHLESQIVRLLQYEIQREPQNYRQVQKLQLFRKRFLYLPPKGATTGGLKSAGCRPLDLGNQKSLTDCTQTKFQSEFSESFQCIVSNRSFISQKKPKFSVCAKIFLQSFLPFFRVSVKSFIHFFFLFLTKRATVQSITHVSVIQTGRRGLV